MIRYRFDTPRGEVRLILRSSRSSEVAEIELEGAAEAIGLIEPWLSRALDDRGIPLGSRTTPERLRFAMTNRNAQRWGAEIVEDDVED